ncbi:DUF6678 family protein [Hymenobacter metallicola]|uniref:Uncharacterized protein n=1 Tax=Hymenobacter metallicola TaxID=2563114 RepID=A0A4Z0PU32_9BACT|nr:DUF6678 family protein [Hymenobacter metallicola]TGE20995.1 hypothetical protein E5K02_24845 [Hymenobacter metallicola]
MQVEEVIDKLTATFPIATRAKLRDQHTPSAWSRWFTLPVPGYIEASTYGPVPKREIEWIELDPVEIWHIGRLVAPKHIDHTPAIYQQLQSEGVTMQMVEGLIRIAL